ncbi:MAG TPA: nucleoside phosphorylase [Bacteroidia bacterium]|nr:nucleoside phosphorylase [Bacteroidia bacterium]
MYQIPETELILNNDGSVYHLNLLPEDIAHTVINVGDPDRVKMVTGFFDSVEIRKQKREFITQTGTYQDKRITVISTGIGTDNIDIVYNELDALVNIDLKSRTIKEKKTSLNLIRIGTSGALREDIAPDDFVFSKFGLGLDGLLNYYKYSNSEEEEKIISAFRAYYPSRGIFPMPYLFSCSPMLEEKISAGMKKGITASCSGFYAPQGRALRFQLSNPGMIDRLSDFGYDRWRITNFEMETGAMYGLASILGHQCCSVNVIVANRITKKHSHRADESMKEMIELVLARVSKLHSE